MNIASITLYMSDEDCMRNSEKKSQLYMLDDCYFYDHAASSIVVESDKTIMEMVELTSAIIFLFEKITFKGEDIKDLKPSCLLKVLCEYYGMKDKKEECQEYIPRILDVELWENIGGIHAYSGQPPIVHLDLYQTRNFCCNGQIYDRIMKKWLPEGERLEALKKLLLEEGINQKKE